MDTKNIKINIYFFKFNTNQNFLYLMVKISKNPGQCAGKKLFFFFIQKMAKIQDNVNPGHCEIQ